MSSSTIRDQADREFLQQFEREAEHIKRVVKDQDPFDLMLGKELLEFMQEKIHSAAGVLIEIAELAAFVQVLLYLSFYNVSANEYYCKKFGKMYTKEYVETMGKSKFLQLKKYLEKSLGSTNNFYYSDHGVQDLFNTMNRKWLKVFYLKEIFISQ